MASKVTVTLISVFIISCAAQRSPYAGRRPIGYPDLETTTTSTTTSTARQNDLGDRFGADDSPPQTKGPPTTTERLPIEALGDRDLVNRLSRLPVDQQPFWFINWKALEAHRGNPQTYPQRVNPFVDRNSISHFFRR